MYARPGRYTASIWRYVNEGAFTVGTLTRNLHWRHASVAPAMHESVADDQGNRYRCQKSAFDRNRSSHDAYVAMRKTYFLKLGRV